MWRELCKYTALQFKDDFENGCFDLWKKTPSVCLPGSGVYEMINSVLSSTAVTATPEVTFDVKLQCFELALTHTMITSSVLDFAELLLASHTDIAWQHLADNLVVMNSVPNVCSRLLGYWLNQDLPTKRAFLQRVRFSVSHLKNELLTINSELCLVLVNCAVGITSSIVVEGSHYHYDFILQCLHSLLHNVTPSCFHVHHIDSPLLGIPEVCCKALNSGAPQGGTGYVHRWCVDVMIKFMNCVCESVKAKPKVRVLVLHCIYRFVVTFPRTLPFSFFKALSELSPGYEELPCSELITTVKNRQSGYDNSLKLLQLACSDSVWGEELSEKMTWQDVVNIRPLRGSGEEDVFKDFVFQCGWIIPDLYENCQQKFLELQDEDSLYVLQYAPLGRVWHEEVYDACAEVISDHTKSYDYRINCAVMIICKTLRVLSRPLEFSDMFVSYFRSLYITTFIRLCNDIDVSVLCVFIRGLTMMDTSSKDKLVFHECLTTLSQYLESNMPSCLVVHYSVNDLATSHPSAFFTYFIRPYASKHNIQTLCALCPKMKGRGKVWLQIERTVLRELLLDTRCSGSCRNVYRLLEEFTTASRSTKTQIFFACFNIVEDVLKRQRVLATGHTPLPLQFSRLLSLLRFFCPPAEYFNTHPDDVYKLEREAVSSSSHSRTVAVCLLWCLRGVCTASTSLTTWPLFFLRHVLTDNVDTLSRQTILEALETVFVVSHRLKHNPVTWTLCNSSPIIRDESGIIVLESTQALKRYMYSCILQKLRLPGRCNLDSVLNNFWGVQFVLPRLPVVKVRELLEYFMVLCDRYPTKRAQLVETIADISTQNVKYLKEDVLKKVFQFLLTNLRECTGQSYFVVITALSDLVRFSYSCDVKKHSAIVSYIRTLSRQDGLVLPSVTTRSRDFVSKNMGNKRLRVDPPYTRLHQLLPELTQRVVSFLTLPTSI
jgi:hypothetical protein